jgi:hypothetical protein
LGPVDVPVAHRQALLVVHNIFRVAPSD